MALCIYIYICVCVYIWFCWLLWPMLPQVNLKVKWSDAEAENRKRFIKLQHCLFWWQRFTIKQGSRVRWLAQTVRGSPLLKTCCFSVNAYVNAYLGPVPNVHCFLSVTYYQSRIGNSYQGIWKQCSDSEYGGRAFISQKQWVFSFIKSWSLKSS